VREAFDNAQENTRLIRGNDIYTCCCAHNHEDDCNWWIEKASVLGYRQACEFHTPNAKCRCKRKL